ncbi:MAG TPA: hypothetical protein ENG16_04480 [Archaeoglobus sp.]|nr:hypothetical protein [Archaeoglobus sp.]
MSGGVLRNRKREKKWKKEDVKRLILKYLAEKGKATKYQIQKELELKTKLKIPFSTILQAMKDLENEGLIEYEIGKRGSHICRLTTTMIHLCKIDNGLCIHSLVDNLAVAVYVDAKGKQQIKISTIDSDLSNLSGDYAPADLISDIVDIVKLSRELRDKINQLALKVKEKTE